MRRAFLFILCYSAGQSFAAFTNGDWNQNLDAMLYIRSHRKLLPRMPPGSPGPPRPPKPPPLTIPEDTSPEKSNRYSSPRPSRGRRSEQSPSSSPYSNERSPTLEAIARKGILQLGRDSSPKRERPPSIQKMTRKLDTELAGESGADGTSRIIKDTTPTKVPPTPSLEAHSLVTGTGYAFSSSKHRYGGLSSQSTADNTQIPVMQSGKDRDWTKAGGVTRNVESKATAVATGNKVTGKLGRGAQDSGSGIIEFRAGSSFQQMHRVGPGEKIERTLNAGQVLDSKNKKLKQVTVTTHLVGEGSCLAAACNDGRPVTLDQADNEKDKQV